MGSSTVAFKGSGKLYKPVTLNVASTQNQQTRANSYISQACRSYTHQGTLIPFMIFVKFLP